MIQYTLTLDSTTNATGYFTVKPEGFDDIEAVMTALLKTPLDTFLRQQALMLMGAMGEEELTALAVGGEAFTAELAYEACLAFNAFGDLRKTLENEGWTAAKVQSPLVYSRFVAEHGRSDHPWAKLLTANIDSFEDLPWAEDAPDLGYKPEPTGPAEALDVACVAAEVISKVPKEERMRAADTASIGRMKLESIGIFNCGELRHMSSLSPIGLMRKWSVDRTVRSGDMEYTLKGEQTSYGKGLSLVDARASLYMEIAERHSSYASIEGGRVVDTLKNHEVIKASYSEMLSSGKKTLDPNTMMIDVFYQDEPLHWMEGSTPCDGELVTIWVPVQAVFLFMNLDEPDLFGSLGSTGLASGNTLEEAKLSGLYEALEREAEATQPYDPALCFELYTANDNLGPLLSAYRQAGIKLFFQEMTGRFGIPCCKAMVLGEDGVVSKGCAVNLDARRAAVSAMTEVTYPFPECEDSAAPPCLPVPVHEEQLPNYSTGSAVGDVQVVERVLAMDNYAPIYVDLTRKDLEIPVVKTLVPGFAFSADCGPFTRISPKLVSCAASMMRVQRCNR